MRRAVPLSAILLASGIAGCAHTHSASGSLAVAATSAPTTVVHQNERTVWSDQVVSTRRYVAAAFAGDRSARVALDRTERIQEAIGQTIKPYYGETAGDGLTTMLKLQLGLTSELIQAVKTGNLEQKEELERRLHENSNATARFLASLNPHWSPTELESMFNRYVELSVDEIVARKDGRFDGDERALEGSLSQARQLADVISDGIVRQFPYGPPYYPRESH
jgi:hypothetical protein